MEVINFTEVLMVAGPILIVSLIEFFFKRGHKGAPLYKPQFSLKKYIFWSLLITVIGVCIFSYLTYEKIETFEEYYNSGTINLDTYYALTNQAIRMAVINIIAILIVSNLNVYLLPKEGTIYSNGIMGNRFYNNDELLYYEIVEDKNAFIVAAKSEQAIRRIRINICEEDYRQVLSYLKETVHRGDFDA